MLDATGAPEGQCGADRPTWVLLVPVVHSHPWSHCLGPTSNKAWVEAFSKLQSGQRSWEAEGWKVAEAQAQDYLPSPLREAMAPAGAVGTPKWFPERKGGLESQSGARVA